MVCDTRTAEQIEKCYWNFTPLLYRIPFDLVIRELKISIKRYYDYVIHKFNRTRNETSEIESFKRSFLYAEYEYKEMVSDIWKPYIEHMDLFHSYMTCGDFPIADRSMWRRSRLGKIADEVLKLDEIVSNQTFLLDLEKTIRPQSWPNLASCLFEDLLPSRNSSFLSRVITEHISVEEFENFNIYFKRYIGNISQSVIKVLGSEETPQMVQLIYDLSKSELFSINWNYIQPQQYYLMLQLKTILLKPDFKQLGKTLIQTQIFIEKAIGKFKNGSWPEMEAFVSRFVVLTLGSNISLSIDQFIPDVKELLDIDTNVENAVHLSLIVDKITSFLDRIADGDEDWFRQLFRDIRGSRWDEVDYQPMYAKVNRFKKYFYFILQIDFTLSFVAVMLPGWFPTSPPMRTSRKHSSTTPSSSQLRPSYSQTGLKMKSIQPALRILSGRSTIREPQSSMLSSPPPEKDSTMTGRNITWIIF